MRESNRLLSSWIVFSLATLILAVTYGLYSQAFSAGFQFDDAPSIAGVAAVHDWPSAIAYLFDGRSGSLGRPLSLLSFLLQKESWPDDASAFFMVNTVIHLLNGVLVFWLSYLLAPRLPGKARDGLWFPLAVAAFWLTLPLHVSASMMAVQRMTTLCSMFMLLGVIGYVFGRSLLDANPVKAYWVMTFSVAMGTLFAVLSKENGVLLPLFILVLEKTLIQASAPRSEAAFRRWVLVFLWLPVVLLMLYFVFRWPVLTQGFSTRTFTLAQRLMTEPQVLWEYIEQILLPRRSGIGPFHDNYPVARSLLDPASASLAIAAWLGLLALAWWWRKRAPLLLFAVLWFLAGHVVESTFLPLELYFEHRNYLASFGLLLALVAVAWNVPDKVRRAVFAGLILALLLRVFVLYEVTSIWGQPLLAAQLWSEDHPESLRAIAYHAGKLSEAGDEEAARLAIMAGFERIPDDSGLALHSVYSNCKHDDQIAFHDRIRRIEPVLVRGALAKNAPALLYKMFEVRQLGACPHLTPEHLFRFTELLMENPRYQAFSGAMVDLHMFRNKLYSLDGKSDLAIREIELAFGRQREYAIALAASRAMANVGRHQDALAFLDRAMRFAPVNPVLRDRWAFEFGKLREKIMREQNANLQR